MEGAQRMSQLAKVGPLCRISVFPLHQRVRLVESENNKWAVAFGMSRCLLLLGFVQG